MTTRNPDHFKQQGNRKHLNQRGLDDLASLFAAGVTPEEAARLKGIPLEGARLRFAEWKTGIPLHPVAD